MEFESWILFLGSLILFAIIGNIVLTQYIISDYDINNKLALAIFSVIFSFSVNSLVLLVFEIWHIGPPESQQIKWMIILSVLVYSGIFILPCIFIFKSICKLNFNCGCKKKKMDLAIKIIGGIVSTLYLYFVMTIVIRNIKESKINEQDFSFWDYAKNSGQFFELHTQINLITLVGTYMIGILSGFGAVNCPFSYFNFDAKQKIQGDIHFIINQISFNKYKIIKLKEKYDQEKGKENTKQTNFFQKFLVFVNIKQDNNPQSAILDQVHYIKADIKSLSKVHEELFQSYCEHANQLQKHYYSKTLKGKFFKFISFIFAGYCIYKITVSTYFYFSPRKIFKDPISRTMEFIFWIFGWNFVKEYYDDITMYSSFFFMGYLIFSNTRSFSLNIMNLLNQLFGQLLSKLGSKDIIVFFISEIFGVYFLTALTLLKYSIPQNYMENLKKISGDIDLKEHYKIFDGIFVSSAMISLALLFYNKSEKNKSLETFQEKQHKQE